MDAKLVEPILIETPTCRGTDAEPGYTRWSAIAVAAFTGSVVAFISGLLASAAAKFSIIPASPDAARWIVAILLTSFALAFLGSHAIDRLDQIQREIPNRK